MRFLFPSVTLAALFGCTPSKEPSVMTSPSSTTSNAAPDPLQAQFGQVATVEGTAEDAKYGALVLLDGSRMIWMDGLDAWPPDVRRKRVRVTGKLIQRSDLPVFVEREGEPAMGGMPVPPGTDLEKARRRFLLAEATWKVLE